MDSPNLFGIVAALDAGNAIDAPTAMKQIAMELAMRRELVNVLPINLASIVNFMIHPAPKPITTFVDNPLLERVNFTVLNLTCC